MTTPADRPTLFCLHFLGGSASSWVWLASRLEKTHRCIGVDLPGFGDAERPATYSVASAADHVSHVIKDHDPGCFGLVGHSMGGKIATVLARRSEDGDAALQGLDRLVLMAASPPGPEPIPEAKRNEMLGWFRGDPAEQREKAARYIDQNCGEQLPDTVRSAVIADVLRARHAAWTAWLDEGSREDWSERIGMLSTPTLVLAGSEDANLGEAAQRQTTMPHLAHARLVTLKGAGHLLPIERAQEVATHIADMPIVNAPLANPPTANVPTSAFSTSNTLAASLG